MHKIYESRRLEEILHLQSVLEGHGILTFTKNTGEASTEGILPHDLIFPELWVYDQAAVEGAARLVREFKLS